MASSGLDIKTASDKELERALRKTDAYKKDLVHYIAGTYGISAGARGAGEFLAGMRDSSLRMLISSRQWLLGLGKEDLMARVRLEANPLYLEFFSHHDDMEVRLAASGNGSSSIDTLRRLGHERGTASEARRTLSKILRKAGYENNRNVARIAAARSASRRKTTSHP